VPGAFAPGGVSPPTGAVADAEDRDDVDIEKTPDYGAICLASRVSVGPFHFRINQKATAGEITMPLASGAHQRCKWLSARRFIFPQAYPFLERMQARQPVGSHRPPATVSNGPRSEFPSFPSCTWERTC
jgi:hypothetical protein